MNRKSRWVEVEAIGRLSRRRPSSVSACRTVWSLLTLFAAVALPVRCPADDEVTLAFAGDVMLADLPGETIAAGGDPFAEFAEMFKWVDVAVANLECVVSTVGEAIEKPYTFRAHPRVLDVVGRHFGAVSLANNHTGDFGHDAFRHHARDGSSASGSTSLAWWPGTPSRCGSMTKERRTSTGKPSRPRAVAATSD